MCFKLLPNQETLSVDAITDKMMATGPVAAKMKPISALTA
jgi:hypothetical protein